MLHNPSTHNMPKPYMTWTQNISTNAKVKINGGKRQIVEKELVPIALTTMGAYVNSRDGPHFGNVNFRDGLYFL